MSNIGKNFTRSNTPQAREFVTNLLLPLYGVLGHLQSKPDQLEAAVEEFRSATATDLIANWKLHDGVIQFSMSPKELQDHFGRPAIAMFRKMFVQVKPGGFSKKTGTSYNSVWCANEAAFRVMTFGLLKHLKTGPVEPSDIVKMLDKIDELVVGITEYAEVEDDKGYKDLIGVERRLMTAAERRKHRQEVKPVRQQLQAFNHQLYKNVHSWQARSNRIAQKLKEQAVSKLVE